MISIRKIIFTITLIGIVFLFACTKQITNERIKNEGEMCGGIAGFMCEEGLKCILDGNYPDAAGICVKEEAKADCPMISQPSPNFCPNGTIKPSYNEEKTCIMGYKCIATPVVNYSCKVDSDCTIKNIGNCCGYYPKCVNKDFEPNPETVQETCKEQGLVSVCGFPEISSCECINSVCVGK
jgi:hypothetical protein